MKANEQHFHVVLFIMLYKMVLTFESVDEILKYFPVVLFVKLPDEVCRLNRGS